MPTLHDRNMRLSQCSTVLQHEAAKSKEKQDKALEAGGDLPDNASVDSEIAGQIVACAEGAPNVFSRDYFGILCVYFIVGIYYGLQAGIIYPVVVVAGGKEREIVVAAGQLITIFWSYKIFFGFVTDFFPIMGYRRKPYIIGGFALSSVVMIVLSIFAHQLSTEAFLFVLTLNNFFYVFADVAGDGMVVQLAHKEPENVRGRTQSAIYMTRTLGMIGTLLVGAIGLNGPSYNGDFDWELDLNYYCAILAALATVPIAGIVFFLKEDKIPESEKSNLSLKHHLKAVYQTLMRRPVYQLIAYTMSSTILMAIMNNSTDNTNNIWLDLSNMQNNFRKIFGKIVFIFGIWIIRTFCLQTSWRLLMVATTALVVIFQSFYYLFTWDVTRNSWLYIVMDACPTLISAMNFIVGTFFIVEVAEPGKEAITYSVLTTCHNLVLPFSSVLSNNIGKLFDLSNADIERDDTEVRAQWSYLQLTVNFINIASLVSLLLLPRQKAEARHLCTKPSNPVIGRCMLTLALAFLIYGTVVTVLTIIPSTQCLEITGGDGC
eukprot:Nk52_evm7s171 gene=Nk52_evmTU7s171